MARRRSGPPDGKDKDNAICYICILIFVRKGKQGTQMETSAEKKHARERTTE